MSDLVERLEARAESERGKARCCAAVDGPQMEEQRYGNRAKAFDEAAAMAREVERERIERPISKT